MEAKIPIGTIASVVGIASGVAGIAGALGGAGAQQGAAQDAQNTQQNMYNQTRSDLLPYNTGGQQAFSTLSNFLANSGPIGTLLGLNPQGAQSQLSALRDTPGYQFAMDQGVEALDRSAASRGLLLSGGQLKDLTAYGQGMGDQLFDKTLNRYDNYAARLGGVASLGENAAAQTGNAGNIAAQGIAQSQMAGGTAQASGITGAASAFQGLMQNGLQAYQAFNSPSPSALPSGGISGAGNGIANSSLPFWWGS